MLRILTMAGLFAAASVAPTLAYEIKDPGSIAYGEPGYMALRIDANILSRNGCGQVVSSRRGAPPNARPSYDVVPVTVTIDMSANCSGNPRVLRTMFPMSGHPNTSLVEIFFVSTTGRLLKSERVAIRLN